MGWSRPQSFCCCVFFSWLGQPRTLHLDQRDQRPWPDKISPGLLPRPLDLSRQPPAAVAAAAASVQSTLLAVNSRLADNPPFSFP